MKFIPDYFKSLLASAGLFMISTTSAWAVFPFSWSTDNSGVISGGDWTGDGTVQFDVVPGTIITSTNPRTIPPAQIAVQNFSAGAITIDNMGGDVFSSNRLLTDPITATQTITLTGGTADLRLHNSETYDDGGSLFNSVGLTNFSNVTAISWTIRFSEPIAGRDSEVGSLTTRAMGAAMALINAGTDTVTGDPLGKGIFTVGMSYSEIYRYDSVNDVFVPGVPAGAVPYQNSGFGTAVAGVTSFNSDEFNKFNEFLLVRGYDMDGVDGYTAADANKVYMTEMTWTIRRDDNLAFASDTLFTMSMDGQQYAISPDIPPAAIPEPSSALLILTTLVGGCLRRRRRD